MLVCETSPTMWICGWYWFCICICIFPQTKNSIWIRHKCKRKKVFPSKQTRNCKTNPATIFPLTSKEKRKVKNKTNSIRFEEWQKSNFTNFIATEHRNSQTKIKTKNKNITYGPWALSSKFRLFWFIVPLYSEWFGLVFISFCSVRFGSVHISTT